MLRSIFPNRGQGKCACCGSSKMDEQDFRDDVSRKEAAISAMCQPCQDDILKEEDEEV